MPTPDEVAPNDDIREAQRRAEEAQKRRNGANFFSLQCLIAPPDDLRQVLPLVR